MTIPATTRASTATVTTTTVIIGNVDHADIVVKLSVVTVIIQSGGQCLGWLRSTTSLEVELQVTRGRET